jgi:nucleoid DNA-binding protein
LLRDDTVLTPLGKFEAVHSPARKIKIPNQDKYVETDGSNLRVKFTPADYFKEKLNAEKYK